jgi:hypothetical protein
MLTALALAALLGAAPPRPDLKLTNVRMTVGELGAPRDSNKFLPGDVVFIAYDIEGLTIDADGNTRYALAMEVTNPAGKIIIDQRPSDRLDFAPLRGNRIPARAYVTVGLDDEPGQYRCKLTVTDPSTRQSADLTVTFEVLKKTFAIVAVYTTHDPKGEIAAPTSGFVGDTLWIQYTIAAFERDAKTMQPDVGIQFQFYDENGNAILVDARNQPVPRKHIQDAKTVPPVKVGAGTFGLRFPVFLNRPGKFVVQMTATDNVSGKTFTYKLPLSASDALGGWAQNSVNGPDVSESGTILLAPGALRCQNSVAVEQYRCAERGRILNSRGPERRICFPLLTGCRCRTLWSRPCR